ncbi:MULTISPECIES: metalloregulator ArsR/SmtB family transcription factor [unclassified Caulobacter]|jgi:DNA-binding transcriptional ArsR family regulator|uniref:ArsR/SmtB family transcription factor n=1 Tax=unclassified Caulobacter TaxID=2648921 RepID=UPI0009E6F8E7|nr:MULTISPECIES: metalloregulator ArsR/SmtB family transcription factor [unclassified Caulobacter]
MTDHLSTTFAALADPTRRAILARLATGEASVNELAEPFEISLPAVSRHLKVLEGAGLISRTREAQLRPCKLEPEALKQAFSWMETYRRFWDDSFDRMAAYLAELQAQSAQTAQTKAAQPSNLKPPTSKRTEPKA